MNDAATIVFWIAVGMAVFGTAGAILLAWMEWRAAVKREIRYRAIRAALRTGMAPEVPPEMWRG